MSLMLSAKSKLVSMDQLKRVPVPPTTNTWRPIPHHRFVELVVRQLAKVGMTVQRQEHGLWGDEGQRYFGALTIGNVLTTIEHVALVVVLRNAHDKRFRASIGCGGGCWICDNLSISAEVVVARKHTIHIMTALPNLIAGAISNLQAAKTTQDRRFTYYQDTDINNSQFHDLAVLAIDAGIVTANKLPRVLNEWRVPRYPEFRDRNAWSGFNAFTQTLKEYQGSENAPRILPRKHLALHNLFDTFTGLTTEAT
jgi:hypothetical protein